MEKHTNRTNIINNIMNFLDSPIFDNKFEALIDKVGVLIIAETPDDLEEFLCITTCEIIPLTKNIKSVLKGTSCEEILCIPNSSINQLVEDLFEFLSF